MWPVHRHWVPFKHVCLFLTASLANHKFITDYPDGMSARTSDEKGVCPSVRLSVCRYRHPGPHNYTNGLLITPRPLALHCTVIKRPHFQGSAIGPAYVVTAANLFVPSHRETVFTLMIRISLSSRAAEIDNVEAWSRQNNLQLNRKKCVEIVFTSSRQSTELLSSPSCCTQPVPI